MTHRPSLTRSIPFWVLFLGSVALTGLGVWLVLERLGRIESSIVNQTPEAAIEVYVGQPAVIAGAAVLAAGLFGLLLTLAVATIRTLMPEPAIDPLGDFDEADDADGNDLPAGYGAPAAAFAPPAASSTESTDDDTARVHGDPAIIDAPAVAPVSEDPDIEVPSATPPPDEARRD